MKSVYSEEYRLFIKYLIEARKNAGITQQGLAKRLAKPQSFVSKYERQERRLDVIEYVSITKIIGIDPCSIIRKIEQDISYPQESNSE